MTLFRLGASCAVLGLLAACTSPSLVERGTYYADTSLHARGADSRIRFLVMHYTESDEAKSLRTLTGDSVSVHYVIPPQPRIEHGMPVVYQLVPEAKRAWHAGVSEWQGTTELNAASIGIENVNRGPLDPENRTWQPYPPAQVDALIRLSKDIVTRYAIPPTRVVGHSDIAPQRKIDPGPLFPWKRLHDAGFGLWPADPTQDPPAGFDPWLALQAIGYSTDNRADTVRAFHHRFRGMEGTELDAQDLRILHALTRTADTTPPAPASP